MAAPGQESIDITQLPLPQLNELNQQLESQIQFFSNSLQSLKAAQQKFGESQECLNKLEKENKNREMLVPLTGSLYVPGSLADTENVLVDIGTGYHIEMNMDQAKKYFKRKVEFLTKEMEKITPVLQEKYQIKQTVHQILEAKVKQQMALKAQQQAVST